MSKPIVKVSVLFLIVLLCLSLGARAEPMAANFTLPNLSRDMTHSLSDYRGQVVYLDFWASWCGPCRQSLPALDRLQKELGEDMFRVLAINLDADPEDGRRFLESYPVGYTVLTDPAGSSARQYELVGLPSSVLVDQRGVIIGSFQGFHEGHIPKLRRAIKLLNE